MKRFYTIVVLVLASVLGAQAQLVINEVLYDPSNNVLDGDANRDGQYSQEGDAFIEFVNSGNTYIDMSGYEIWDDTLVGELRFEIPNGTVLAPGAALVVFGGGTPTGDFGHAIVLVDTSAVGMNLNNSGEVIVIKDSFGQVLLTFDSDALSNNPDESYTRNPDISGDFEQHGTNKPRLFSPGRTVDSTQFAVEMHLQGIIDFTTPEGGSSGKGIHVVADSAVSDLSQYGIGVANNGGGSDGREYSFPAVAVNMGDDILVVRDSAAMVAFLAECSEEFEHIFVDLTEEVNMNGDDAIEFYIGSYVLDVYGDPDVDGTGEDWEYSDAWAYLTNGVWVTGEIDCTDDAENIYFTGCRYPICQDVNVMSIMVEGEGSVNSISVDDGSLQMIAMVNPNYAIDTTVTWSIDDQTIASIDANGLLSAIKDGTVEVKATSNDNGVEGTAMINITNQLTGINNISQVKLQLYPNPALNTVTLAADQQIKLVEFYDVSGKMILSVGQQFSEMDISKLPHGIYTLKVITSASVAQLRLIKQQ